MGGRLADAGNHMQIRHGRASGEKVPARAAIANAAARVLFPDFDVKCSRRAVAPIRLPRPKQGIAQLLRTA
jgi:hypothetical protein